MSTSPPEVILGPYEPGLVAKRECFAAPLGRITFLERGDGGTEAILHDVQIEGTDEPTVQDVEISPIGLGTDRAVLDTLKDLSGKVSALESVN